MSGRPAGPTLPCPECRAAIPVDIAALLRDGAVACPSCGLALRVDRAGSRQAIDALARWQAGVREAEDILARAMPPGSG